MEIPFKLYSKIPRKTLELFAMFSIGVRDFHKVILHNGFSFEEKNKFEMCIKKFESGMPVEYIVGECNFYGLDFIVSDAVLIPRIDTEILVECAVKFIKNQNFSVLDLCTGSGCIPIGIAKSCQNAKFLAVDISKNALEICKENIKKHNLENRIKTQECNILMQIPAGNFDVIISNPPYIETNVVETLEKSVKDFEPKLALDGGHDGLKFYRKILEYIGNKPAFLEIGFNQGEKIVNLAKNFGIENVQIIKDYANNDRVCILNVGK